MLAGLPAFASGAGGRRLGDRCRVALRRRCECAWPAGDDAAHGGGRSAEVECRERAAAGGCRSECDGLRPQHAGVACGGELSRPTGRAQDMDGRPGGRRRSDRAATGWRPRDHEIHPGPRQGRPRSHEDLGRRPQQPGSRRAPADHRRRHGARLGHGLGADRTWRRHGLRKRRVATAAEQGTGRALPVTRHPIHRSMPTSARSGNS